MKRYSLTFIALFSALTVYSQTINLKMVPANWTIKNDKSMVTFGRFAESAGQCAILKDNSYTEGAGILSKPMPISAGAYKLTGKILFMDGMGCNIRVVFLDENKKWAAHAGLYYGSRPEYNKWLPFKLEAYDTSKKAKYVQIQSFAFKKVKVGFALTDMQLTPFPIKPIPPAWEAQYKIKPSETKRLTAADIVGPDGIVYPNWSMVGVQGGIPKIKNTVKIRDFGGIADDGKDDSNALLQAIEKLANNNGGAVLLDQGLYHLDKPVVITYDNIVIKGQGQNKTKILFRYNVGDAGIEFYGLQQNQTIGPATAIWVHCKPKNLHKITLNIDKKHFFPDWKYKLHSGNTFNMYRKIRGLKTQLSPGKHTLYASAVYKDGSINKCQLQINYDPNCEISNIVNKAEGAILFKGKGFSKTKYLLAEDGKRGSKELVLKTEPDLKKGDLIRIKAPATPRWNKLVRNSCSWGQYRLYQAFITNVDGKRISIAQPLRLDFPEIDGSYIEKIDSISRCGVEGFSFEQTHDLWLTSVLFKFANNCWARDIKVTKCGRHPIYSYYSKFCEIRDCIFDDAWFKGGGGTAYVGWERSYDCLMENVVTYKMRHAPIFQWAASGNVIRKGTFYDSDAQWHSGWTNENLMEQCKVISTYGNGGYGYGMWASPPEDGSHGPNGPRNAIFNCDVSSDKATVWLGGMNENWLILHNRFISEKGTGILIKTMGFDHIIKGNVVALKNPEKPMVRLETPDCTGCEIIDNKLYGGNGKFYFGLGEPLVCENNEALPYQAEPAAPKPKVPSIYEWQKEHVGKNEKPSFFSRFFSPIIDLF